MTRDLPQPGPNGAGPRNAQKRSDRIRARNGHLRAGDLLLVFLGGAAGTASREAVSLLLPTLNGIPTATFAVNIVGAFLLGLLLESLCHTPGPAKKVRRVRLLLGTGFMGGFTTYSTFAVEGTLMLGEGHVATGVLYALGTVLLGAAATWLGIACGARRARRSAHGRATR